MCQNQSEYFSAPQECQVSSDLHKAAVHCMHCKGCHCRRNRCPCSLLKLNTKWAKGHDEGRVSRDYSRTSSLRQRPLCPSHTQQRHHLKKVFFPKYAGQDFGLHLRCVIYNFRKMTEISKNSLKNSCLDLSYCAILESGVFAKSFMLKGHNLFLLGPFWPNFGAIFCTKCFLG